MNSTALREIGTTLHEAPETKRLTRRLGASVPALVLVGLLAAGSAEARGCHDRGVDALARAIQGEKVTPKGLSDCRGDLRRPPAGSGNWPIQIESALYYSGHTDGRVLLPWLEGGPVWGHNGKESGSPIYEAWNWASAIAVHHRADAIGDRVMREASRRWLRAMAAKMALAASPSSPARIRFGQGGKWYERERVNYFRYEGPFVHLVGDRAQENPKRGKFTGSWAEVNRRHGALAWAVDWPGRRHGGDFLGAKKGGSPDPGTLLLWTIARLGKVKHFGATVEPAVFGLDDEERAALRAFLEQPTHPRRAARLASWLEGYPRPAESPITIRRYQDGKILTVLGRTRNANKSGAVVVGFDGRNSIWIAPSRFRGVGAATAFGKIEDGRALAVSGDGHRMELRIGDWGALAWELEWGADGPIVRPGRGATR